MSYLSAMSEGCEAGWLRDFGYHVNKLILIIHICVIPSSWHRFWRSDTLSFSSELSNWLKTCLWVSPHLYSLGVALSHVHAIGNKLHQRSDMIIIHLVIFV